MPAMGHILKITAKGEIYGNDIKRSKRHNGLLKNIGIAATLAERISYAKAKKLSYEEFLELRLSDEFERREARGFMGRGYDSL